jgi:hypothetical protein
MVIIYLQSLLTFAQMNGLVTVRNRDTVPQKVYENGKEIVEKMALCWHPSLL